MWQHAWSELARALYEDGVRLIVCDSGYLAAGKSGFADVSAIAAGLRNANCKTPGSPMRDTSLLHQYDMSYYVGLPCRNRSPLSRRGDSRKKQQSHLPTSAEMNHPALRGQQHQSIDKKFECFVKVLCTRRRNTRGPIQRLKKMETATLGLLDTPSSNANKSRCCEIQHLTFTVHIP